jgi:hypothetical protein
MTVLKKKLEDTKCSDQRIFCLIAHTIKIVARTLTREIERNLKMCLEKISLDVEEEQRMQLGC